MIATTMHTDEQIKRAVELAEAGDPAGPTVPTPDLREIAEAASQVEAASARVREAVEVARAKGRSWGQIGAALGVTRQAARQRFSE